MGKSKSQKKGTKFPDLGEEHQNAVRAGYCIAGAVRTHDDIMKLHMFWSSFMVPAGMTNEEVAICMLLEPLRQPLTQIRCSNKLRDPLENALVMSKMTRRRFKEVIRFFIASAAHFINAPRKIRWALLNNETLQPGDIWAWPDPNPEKQGIKGVPQVVMGPVDSKKYGKVARKQRKHRYWRPVVEIDFSPNPPPQADSRGRR